MSLITSEFVRGFASRACQVDTSMAELVMTSGDKALLERIGTFLRGCRIRCTVAQVNDRYRLRIRGLDSLLQWRAQIGFMDLARNQKVDIIITTLESKRNG